MNSIGQGGHTSLGVSLLDRDHNELEEILAEIRFRAELGLAGPGINALLRKLAHRTRLHFALEEEMMSATRYPGMAVHRLQHQWLIDQIRFLAGRTARKALVNGPDSLNFLSESHFNHVRIADLHYGLWLENRAAIRAC